MTSQFTPLGFNEQGAGDNANTWGDVFNTEVTALVDEAIRGIASFVLSGTVTLAATNGTSNQARCAILNITSGSGGIVQIPDISKVYVVFNQSTGNAVIEASGATVATFEAGDAGLAFCDGTNVRQFQLAGLSLRDFINQAILATTGSLPATTGNEGKSLFVQGGAWTPRRATAADVDGVAPALSPTITGGVTLSGSVKESVVAMAALNMDLAAGEVFTKTISSNSAFTFSNLTASKAQAWVLRLTTSASAAPTFTGAQWSGGAAPNFGNGKHLVGFVSYDGTEIAAVLISSQYA